jgi:hypothetical protein
MAPWEFGAMTWRSIVTVSVALLPIRYGSAAEPSPVFPVMAWNNSPSDLATLKRMRACGLTVAGFVPPSGLENCRAAGLKAIVSDPRISDYDWRNVNPAVARARVTELVKQVKDHPSVFGYYLIDEPSADLFHGLATVANLVKELHPGAWPYINLLPNYADVGQFGAPTYQAYLDRFVEVCRPPVLSYDHYALFEGGGLRSEYFPNLEAMRTTALKHAAPFWNIVLSNAHFNYSEPSPAGLRFQVYTSLAHGARGLAYFTYFAPQIGNFRMAPVDQFGNETATWQWMQTINHEIEKLGPTLLNLRTDRVYHFGDVPKGCAGPDDQSLVRAIDGQMLVGDFTHADRSRFVMVVNKSLTGSHPCRPQFRDPSVKVQMISAFSGSAVAFEGEQIWLAPGQGALLRLQK